MSALWQQEMGDNAPKDRAFLAYVPKLGGWVVVDPRWFHDEICIGVTRPNNHRVWHGDVLAIDDLPSIPVSAK